MVTVSRTAVVAIVTVSRMVIVLRVRVAGAVAASVATAARPMVTVSRTAAATVTVSRMVTVPRVKAGSSAASVATAARPMVTASRTAAVATVTVSRTVTVPRVKAAASAASAAVATVTASRTAAARTASRSATARTVRARSFDRGDSGPRQFGRDRPEDRPVRVPNARDLRSANRPDRERSPQIDEDVTGKELDRATQHQIKTLEGNSAEWVARHLVMAGRPHRRRA